MNYDNLHPTYSEYHLRWLMARDFYDGGKAIIQPSYNVDRISLGDRVEIKSTNEISSERTDTRTIWEWGSQPQYSYLFKHSSETSEEFQNRGRRAIHIPVFKPIINNFISAIFRHPIERNVDDSSWEIYHDDIDGQKTSMDELLRRVSIDSLQCGHGHVLIDVTKINRKVISLGQQQSAGIRAYAKIISPLDLIDWEQDSNGEWEWVIIREIRPTNRQPGERFLRNQYQYRIITRVDWRVVAIIENQWITIDSGNHNLGVVPLASIWASRQFKMDTESPFASILDADRYFYNKFSETDTVCRLQSFSQLLIPTVDDTPGSPVELGPGRALAYPHESHFPPSYISADSSIPNGIHTRAKELIIAVKEASNTTRGAAEESKEARSALAINTEWTDRNNQMSLFSAQVEQMDHDIHRFIAAWEKRDDYPKATYSRTFDLRTLGQQINELQMLKSLNTLSDAEIRRLVRPIISKALREQGYSNKKINEILEDDDDFKGLPVSEM